MLKSINLGITGMCNANCKFCPREDGPVKLMPLDLIDKIICEISSNSFKNKHMVSSIWISENCEPTLHPFEGRW